MSKHNGSGRSSSAAAATTKMTTKTTKTPSAPTPQRTARTRQKPGVPSASPFKGGGVSSDEAAALKELGTELGASDWKERESAIEKLRVQVLASPQKFGGATANVFFEFVPRLQDSNSKVNVSALKALCEMLPLVGESLELVIPEMLGSLSNGLASKNATINQLTQEAVALLVQHGNPAHMVQPFMIVLLNSNSVVRESLLPYLAELVAPAYEANPNLVLKHIVKGCVTLLSDSKVRAKMAPVWTALDTILGPTLYKQRAMTGEVVAQVQSLLQAG
eukprot:m.145981 g.145981  ORF g.145981 m.145981 type:complete len:276 (-) comp16070_c0_seq1:406-1233(-)